MDDENLMLTTRFDDAETVFQARLEQPLDDARQAALAALRASVSAAAMVSVFRRFKETNQPPDGGRGGATPVLAAATPNGIAWATVPVSVGAFRKRLGDPVVGFDTYADFEVITFSAAEVLLEGSRGGDITFGTERAITTSEGEYARALQFTIACAELGFGGRAKVSEVFAPTSENIADARRALGLD